MFKVYKDLFPNIIAVVITIVIFHGCQSELNIHEAPEIYYGEDTCMECSMIISDPHFAAAYINNKNEIKKFDDIGGMFISYFKNSDTVIKFWVHDYQTGTWINANEAHFLINNNIITPMGHGVIAFYNYDEALLFVDYANPIIKNITDILELSKKYKDGDPLYSYFTSGNNHVTHNH
tara:strand:+ start:920 stop:1450 length:531 start_codon:yes stop_codon:yes gene_type:complete